MKISYTGHGIEVTQALKELTDSKLEKLKRHSDDIMTIQVTFSVENLMQKVEATIHVSGIDVHASAQDQDMYKAVDMLISKCDRQLIKYKEKQRD